MEKVGTLYGHLEYTYLLRPFGTFNTLLVIYWKFGIFSPRFGILCQEKSGNPVAAYNLMYIP
jgi:hypothetical protein